MDLRSRLLVGQSIVGLSPDLRMSITGISRQPEIEMNDRSKLDQVQCIETPHILYLYIEEPRFSYRKILDLRVELELVEIAGIRSRYQH